MNIPPRWFIRARSRLAWVWTHRTKALGTVAMGVGYVDQHQGQLHIFLPPLLEKYAVIAFGAAAFLLGVYNTYAAKREQQEEKPPT